MVEKKRASPSPRKVEQDTKTALLKRKNQANEGVVTLDLTLLEAARNSDMNSETAMRHKKTSAYALNEVAERCIMEFLPVIPNGLHVEATHNPLQNARRFICKYQCWTRQKNNGDGSRAIARVAPSLQYLSLQDCRVISDDGLATISEGCTNLELVDLKGTAVTDKGIEALEAQCLRLRLLSNCERIFAERKKPGMVAQTKRDSESDNESKSDRDSGDDYAIQARPGTEDDEKVCKVEGT
ncbi:unnamed protein product [Peronospora destructor]|uniref:F-box/LRR-repeat protein 15-like leucin rich repeat domain-containing protein n=1 Tax=Peronospora destructor TaxID=86335 RepID=A0AAV0VDQ5_9STRA|nr:unnamed protein product [Peronospora destructor]